MNWEAIGAVAELLGAIGVIGSLLYLGSQIRDTRRALRASTYQTIDESLATTMSQVITVPGLDQTVAAGMASYEGLGAAEGFRFSFWMSGVMRRFENVHYQYRSGMLDADRWEVHRTDLVALFALPGVVQWWSSETNMADPDRVESGPAAFGPEFNALVSRIVGD